MFSWQSSDISSILPSNWTKDILAVARKEAVDHYLVSGSVTSRELGQDHVIPVHTMDGILVRRFLPWLSTLYHGPLSALAQQFSDEPVMTARRARSAVNINLQFGPDERYECHVDSNPIQGILYVTTHPPGCGGELVVANRPDSVGVRAIADDASRIYPIAGNFVLFDARKNPHYVAPLTSAGAVRAAAVMNFYTPSCPEDKRPPDLDGHLFPVTS